MRTPPTEGSVQFENAGRRQPHPSPRRWTDVRAFIELSGEHPTLPRAEALAALASERVEVRTASFDNQVLRIDAVGPVERATHRLGLAHLVYDELAAGAIGALRCDTTTVDLH